MTTNDYTKTTYIMSNGMGVESTAILLRWILEPATAPCSLQDLIVVTSQVGDEYRDTLADFETHILPLFRAHGIRYVQVARAGHLEADGYVVLEDSRQPTRMFGEGAYKLSDELRGAGTLPQFGGDHICSQKFKAFVIESWIRDHIDGGEIHHAYGYNRDEPTRVTKCIAFGFNRDEQARVAKAAKYATSTRLPFFPLVEWGWGREECLAYIEQHLGVRWQKSACVYCPFAHNKQNEADLLARHKAHPEQVADALMLEHVALALNPRAQLYAKDALVQITTAAGNTQALAQFKTRLASVVQPWAVYRVRRLYKASKSKPGAKGTADRCVERVFDYKTQGEAQEFLSVLARRKEAPIDEARGIRYLYTRRRVESWPTSEDYYVAAPAAVETKARYGVPKFNAAWETFHTDLTPQA